MTADLLTIFMPRFLSIARSRIARSLDLANQRSVEHVPAIARELHAIAGEAGLLGLGEIVSFARAGEGHAKNLRSTGNTADAEALVAVLSELRDAIERVVPRSEANT